MTPTPQPLRAGALPFTVARKRCSLFYGWFTSAGFLRAGIWTGWSLRVFVFPSGAFRLGVASFGGFRAAASPASLGPWAVGSCSAWGDEFWAA